MTDDDGVYIGDMPPSARGASRKAGGGHRYKRHHQSTLKTII